MYVRVRACVRVAALVVLPVGCHFVPHDVITWSVVPWQQQVGRHIDCAIFSAARALKVEGELDVRLSTRNMGAKGKTRLLRQTVIDCGVAGVAGVCSPTTASVC